MGRVFPFPSFKSNIFYDPIYNISAIVIDRLTNIITAQIELQPENLKSSYILITM
jgi:hypothetical protein